MQLFNFSASKVKICYWFYFKCLAVSSQTSIEIQFLKHNIKGAKGVVVLIIWIISSACILHIKVNTITVSFQDGYQCVLEYVLIPWVFMKHAISLNIVIYLSYMNISVGLLVNFQILSQQGFFRSGAWFHSDHHF